MLLIYSILWSWWKVSRNYHLISKAEEDENNKHFQIMRENLYQDLKRNRDFENELKTKTKNVFLVKNIEDILTWEKKSYKVSLKSEYLITSFTGKPFKVEEFDIKYFKFFGYIQTSPLYLQLAGLGDYYKGIYSLKKYYPHWKLISEAITDLLTDLFIVSTEKIETEKENKELLGLFEKLFTSKFYIQNDRIYIQEKNRKYGIEKTASGLKSLSWFYLILRYNLAGKFLFIDEPEVNLHPVYIDKLAYFLYKLSHNRKVFIATHSDYLLESFNKLMNKHDFKIDVWKGELENDGAVYTSYQADKDNLIDTTPLTEVFLDILKEGFGHGKN